MALDSTHRGGKKPKTGKPRVIRRKDRDGGHQPRIMIESQDYFKRILGHADPESIFKGDMIVIKPWQIINNLYEVLTAYAIMRHRREFEDERDLCPYNTNLETDELVFKQQMTWFLFARTDPATGLTIVEEFVKENDVPDDLAEELLQATQIFHDYFRVVRKKGDKLVLYSMTRRKKYVVATHNPTGYPVGCVIDACIHPSQGQHKLCGVTAGVSL